MTDGKRAEIKTELQELLAGLVDREEQQPVMVRGPGLQLTIQQPHPQVGRHVGREIFRKNISSSGLL